MTRLCQIEDIISLLGLPLPPKPPQMEHIDAEYVFNNPLDRMDVIAQLHILLAVICHVIMGMRESWCNFIIGVVAMTTCQSIATGLKMDKEGKEDFGATQKNVLKQLPTSLYGALQALQLDGETTLYAVCPVCSFCHKGEPSLSTSSAFPAQCTRLIPGHSELEICGAELLEHCHGGFQPKKPFLLASLQEYIAKSLLDPEIERFCDQACDDALAQCNVPLSDRDMTNAFDGGFLRDFMGPDGSLFINRGGKV
ncbi:hypothetical protein EDD85DRAFT_962808 [Armillaria nabsnona]|nr:hypothetical protein EDD85DRAFT_962808 [Armillaria nabsnona]